MAGLSFKLKESVIFSTLRADVVENRRIGLKWIGDSTLRFRLFRVLQTIDPYSTREATRHKSRDLVNIGRTKKI